MEPEPMNWWQWPLAVLWWLYVAALCVVSAICVVNLLTGFFESTWPEGYYG